MPSIPEIQDTPLASEPERYTFDELDAALLAIEAFFHVRDDKIAMAEIAASLPSRVLDLTIQCIDHWLDEKSPTIH